MMELRFRSKKVRMAGYGSKIERSERSRIGKGSRRLPLRFPSFHAEQPPKKISEKCSFLLTCFGAYGTQESKQQARIQHEGEVIV